MQSCKKGGTRPRRSTLRVKNKKIWKVKIYERCIYVICRAYILCLTNLRILSLETGRGAVQKLARGAENLIYGSDYNISGFCGIVFRLLSSGSRHGVILSQLGYSPVFQLQLLRD